MNTILIIFSFVFISVWLPNNGFVLQSLPEHQSNAQQGSNSDYTIDLEIEDGDYELVDEYEKDMETSEENVEHIEDSESTTSEKNKEIKSKSSNGRSIGDKRSKGKITDVATDKSDAIQDVTTHPPPATFNQIRKRRINSGHIADVMNKPCEKYRDDNNPSFKCSGIRDPNSELENSNSKSYFKILDSLKEYFSCDKCSSEDAEGIGFRAIRCLLSDYSESRQPCDVLAVRLWNIIVLWLVVYLVIAIPLWCTKGWCCCCLCCQFFKPQETIQEAKNYLLLNPPGVLITKKGAVIHYEPTEREKDCYEEFGHFIRTL